MDYPDRNTLAAREKELLERFIKGDENAFAGLADLYKDRIHQFILCILGPDREAEDIAQEVFVQIYRALPSFRGGSAFSTWAYAVTRNVCRHRLRARGREAGFMQDSDGGVLWNVQEPGPGPGPALESEETKRIVRAQIAMLSPVHRAVIFLSCWEKLSYAEIAQALDIPLGTVRSRLHNALAALALRLKPALAEEERL